MIIFIVLIISVRYVASVEKEFVEYTRVSKTLSGKACLTGCSENNECIVDWTWNKESCQTFEPAPIYLTTRLKDPGSKYCLTNCDYFGEKTQWCITTKDLKWDYCTNFKRVPFTGTMTTSEFVATQTVASETCLGPCNYSSCTPHYWCSAKNQWNWHYCALPALSRIPVLPLNFNVGQKQKVICEDFLKLNAPGADFSYAAKFSLSDGFLEELADAIEKTTGKSDTVARIVRLDDTKDPTEHYITVNVNNMYVPAIIRAHINKYKLVNLPNVTALSEEVEAKVRQQMAGTTNPYVLENLVSVSVGGSNKEFNVVPMSEDLNCVWFNLWEAARGWVRDTNGSVDVLVVVFYPDINTPVPKAFGISLTFRNTDSSLFVACRETVYLNIMT